MLRGILASAKKDNELRSSVWTFAGWRNLWGKIFKLIRYWVTRIVEQERNTRRNKSFPSVSMQTRVRLPLPRVPRFGTPATSFSGVRVFDTFLSADSFLFTVGEEMCFLRVLIRRVIFFSFTRLWSLRKLMKKSFSFKVRRVFPDGEKFKFEYVFGSSSLNYEKINFLKIGYIFTNLT